MAQPSRIGEALALALGAVVGLYLLVGLLTLYLYLLTYLLCRWWRTWSLDSSSPPPQPFVRQVARGCKRTGRYKGQVGNGLARSQDRVS